MVRAGLGPRWQCLFANDFDFKKSAVYEANWGADALTTKDVGTIDTNELPGVPGLVWASFPCQDLSLAGMGAGLRGERSGTFWPFWRLVEGLAREGRAPKLIVLENVCGTLTSHAGKDFTAIAEALSGADYRFGAVVIDAALFVPQSRPRLFIVAVAANCPIDTELLMAGPRAPWHPKALRTAYGRLPEKVQNHWLWWNIAPPSKRKITLSSIREENPTSVSWHTAEETARLLGMMTPLNLQKVRAAQKSGKLLVGTIYKRTRLDENGYRRQRAEVRFDGIAGCLRTPAGGSSRQVVIVVKGKVVRSRLISSRETARLMGLPDDYKIPDNYNEAYHLTGDGVVVPVVRHLAEILLERILVCRNQGHRLQLLS